MEGGEEVLGPDEKRELAGEAVLVGYSWAGMALCRRRPSVAGESEAVVASAAGDCQVLGSRFR